MKPFSMYSSTVYMHLLRARFVSSSPFVTVFWMLGGDACVVVMLLVVRGLRLVRDVDVLSMLFVTSQSLITLQRGIYISAQKPSTKCCKNLDPMYVSGKEERDLKLFLILIMSMWVILPWIQSSYVCRVLHDRSLSKVSRKSLKRDSGSINLISIISLRSVRRVIESQMFVRC